MDQNMADEHCNTDTDEGTIAFHRKRSRRVSFAENTMVHIFDRDEECETPPEPNPSSSDNPSETIPSFNDLGFHHDSSDASDSKEYSQNEEEDVDELDSRISFLRPVESPSSGSIIGSATSNDDFFGPVSASFIKPGQLSSSSSSDENNDVTKDSTFFSMHFRSLARSESGDLITSTGARLSFEEKTPTQDSAPTNQGSSMVLTEAKKPNTLSCTPIAKLSSGNDSNDMSLVGEGPHKYDFGVLSPALDALLAEGNKDFRAVTITDNTSVSKSLTNVEGNHSASKELEGGLMDLIDDGDSEIGGITHDMPKEGTPVGKSEDPEKDSFEMSHLGLNFSAVGHGTNSNKDIQRLVGFTQKEYRSPLTGFISSSKQSEMLLDTFGASKSPWILTPSQKQTSSLLDESIVIHSKSAASIQKSMSRLAMLEASPFYSTPNAKINNSTFKSLGYLLESPPLESLSDQNGTESQVKPVKVNEIEASQLASVAQKKGEQGSLVNMDDNRTEIPEDIDVRHSEAMSVEKIQPSLLPLDHAEETLIIAGTNSVLSGPKLDYVEDNRAHGTPHKIFSSPAERLEISSITSPEYQSRISKDLRAHVQHNKTADNLEMTSSPMPEINYSKGLTESGTVDDREINIHNLQDKTGNTGNSSNLTGKLDSVSMEIISLPVTEIHNLKGSTEAVMMDDRETDLHDLRDKPGNTGNSPNLMRDKDPQNIQCRIPDNNFQTGSDATFENELPGGRVNATTCGSASPFARSSEASLQRHLLEAFSESPSTKEIQNVPHDETSHTLVLEDRLSPNSGQLTNGFKNSSARKRKNEEVTLRDRDHMKEIAGTHRSPKLHKGPIRDSESSEHQNESNSGTLTGVQEMKHWTESYSKFLGDTEKILSSSSDKLNLREIDILDDMLIHTQRSRTYEILQTHLQSQKTFDPLSNIQHKRVTEARLLLHKILHKRLKLKLMRVKRERLLQKVQLVNSGIQESEMLKSNYLSQRSVSVEVNNRYQQPSEEIQKVARDKTALQQALETSERRIMSLTNIFHTSCKMKGDPGCADTILSVNDHLVKRTRSRFIRLDSQLWMIDSLESKNGCHNVVLNYLDFITQRLNINRPASNISISNILNNTNINKSLPDMDVCTAFAFVLNSEATRKYVGPRSLAQETQTSNILLGNLLDVAEEVQQARMELRNLTQTSFHSRSAEQLDLQLCFFDFKNSRKAVLTLDMSCLERGIYPSDTVPYFPAGSQNSFSEQLSGEIRGAVHNLGAGYFRIIRLCRCISQVVQASTR